MKILLFFLCPFHKTFAQRACGHIVNHRTSSFLHRYRTRIRLSSYI